MRFTTLTSVLSLTTVLAGSALAVANPSPLADGAVAVAGRAIAYPQCFCGKTSSGDTFCTLCPTPASKRNPRVEGECKNKQCWEERDATVWPREIIHGECKDKKCWETTKPVPRQIKGECKGSSCGNIPNSERRAVLLAFRKTLAEVSNASAVLKNLYLTKRNPKTYQLEERSIEFHARCMCHSGGLCEKCPDSD
jgi:hypothetical protein